MRDAISLHKFAPDERRDERDDEDDFMTRELHRERGIQRAEMSLSNSGFTVQKARADPLAKSGLRACFSGVA